MTVNILNLENYILTHIAENEHDYHRMKPNAVSWRWGSVGRGGRVIASIFA